MPIIPNNQPTGFTQMRASPAPQFGTQDAPDIWGPAFRMENDVVNFVELIEDNFIRSWQDEPDFDLVKALRENDMWEDYRQNFLDVGSQAEFNYVLGRIRREESDRQILQSSGLPGLLAASMSGMMSPVALLPFTGGAKGLVAVRNAAAWGFAGGVAQEIPLQMNQITRTGEETAFSIAASTVLSGILGGAVGLLRRGEMEELARQLDEIESDSGLQRVEGDMADLPGKSTIPEPDAVRVARAEEQGFTTVGYHGSRDVIETLDPAKTRLGRGVFFSKEPGLADEFAFGTAVDDDAAVLPDEEGFRELFEPYYSREQMEALDRRIAEWKALPEASEDENPFLTPRWKAHKNLVDEAKRVTQFLDPETLKPSEAAGGRPNVTPVRIRLGKTYDYTFEGPFNWDEEARVIATAREGGYDSVTFHLERVSTGEQQTFYTVFDAENIRSTFDPYPPVGYDTIGTTGTTGAQSLGAASARQSAGRLQQGPGIPFLAEIGPVTRVLQQTVSKQAQWMMGQLANAGLRTEGNKRGIATAVGGTAENRIKTYYSMVARTYQKIDEQYAEYKFDRVATTAERLTAGIGRRPGKLSKAEFKEQVARALWVEETHPIPQVAAAAKFMRSELYDPILEKAQAVGMFKNVKADEFAEETDDLLSGRPAGDLSYLNRSYKDEVIRAREAKFVDILSAHFERKLQAQFQQQLGKLIERQGRDAELAEDLGRSAEEVAELRRTFQEELKFLDESLKPEEADIEDFIAAARSQAVDKSLTKEHRKDARDMAEALIQQAGPGYQKRQARRRELNRRLRNLNRSIVSYTARQQAKLAKAERAEELQLNSLQRVVRSGQRFLREMDMLTDERFEARAVELRNEFESLGAKYDAQEERLLKMSEEVDPTNFNDEVLLLARQGDTGAKMSRVVETLEGLETMNRELVRSVVDEGLNEVLRKVNTLNGKRAMRADRLREQAENLDPAVAKERLESTLSKMRERRDNFLDDWRTRGADLTGADLPATKADFAQYTRGLAEEVKDHILGVGMRLPGLDLIQDLRGAELARVLDIPSEQIAEFLETDVEKLAMLYVRTLAPDIEIRAKLGDLAPDMEKNLEFRTLNEEASAKKRALTERLTAEGNTPEQIEKATLKLDRAYEAIRRDLEAVIGRLRGTYGLPKEPHGIANRMGLLMRNLNVLRFMGSVTVSSIPDLARPIQKYGLTRTFRDGWLPLTRGMSQLKLTAREMRLAGAATDLILHSRAHQMFDIGDHLVRGSKFEKGVEFATNKMGILATFDIWTTGMKQIVGNIAILKIIDDVDVLVNGKAGAAKASEDLAASGIDRNLADIIWKLVVSPGGGEKVNGTWFPNTENWTTGKSGVDKQTAQTAVDAFRAALVGQVDDTIITPGVERPLLSNSTPLGKMIFQFKSFGMSSTTKTMMAGLQQRDAAFVQGTMLSLALGAMSYYIWAMTVGGDALETAMQLDSEKWADEAISRSGNLAVFAEVQDILSQIPLTQPYVTFSGQRTTRRGGEGLVEAALGPSFDLITSGASVLSGIDDPTQSTAHKLRLMLPLQNHFMLRQLFDQIEAGAAVYLPERRN